MGASGSWGGAADRVARGPRRSLRGYGTWCARSTDRYLRPAVWQRLRPEPYRGNARHAARPGPVVARPMSGRAGTGPGSRWRSRLARRTKVAIQRCPRHVERATGGRLAYGLAELVGGIHEFSSPVL